MVNACNIFVAKPKGIVIIKKWFSLIPAGNFETTRIEERRCTERGVGEDSESHLLLKCPETQVVESRANRHMWTRKYVSGRYCQKMPLNRETYVTSHTRITVNGKIKLRIRSDVGTDKNVCAIEVLLTT
jgi:hypothetical protein